MESKNSVYVRTMVQHHSEKATLMEPEVGHWTRRLPWILSGLGAAMLVGAAGLGVAAVRLIAEEQAVRNVLLDIAKNRDLPEKLVPAVRGSLTMEMIALALAVGGGILIFAGLAVAARLRWRTHRFTIGEDPQSTWVCSSKRLPDPCFPLATLEGDRKVRFQVCEGMGGLVQVDDHEVHTLATYSRNFGNPLSPVVRTFAMEDFREVRIEQDQQVFIFSRSAPASLHIPLHLSTGLFGVCLGIALVLGLAISAYLGRLSEDPIFGDRVESHEIVLARIVKSPDLVAEKKQQLKEIQQKDEIKPKNFHEPSPVAEKTSKSTYRDPRKTESVAFGPASRNPGPAGIGVANVLASSVSVMTASLTASNTVFGQETEDLSDLLGDFNDVGENPDGGFGPRGGPGGGPGGGLSIGGPPTTGWGGIFSDRSGPPSFAPIDGAKRRREPVLRDGRSEVSGKMDPNEVRAVIRAHRNEVHHCYQKGLLENDRAAGVVRVVFHLNPTGRAIECRIEENLSVASVGNCICARIQGWRFPQPEGGLAKISYSWTLQPGGL